MREHEALLRNIIKKPDDDAPRLIYADWLEEQGQEERAEFIRVQCKREKVWQYPHLLQLKQREKELLDGWAVPEKIRNWSAWAGDFLTNAAGDTGLLFYRGFVTEIVLTCQSWHQNKKILMRYPLLEYARMVDCNEYYPATRRSWKRMYIQAKEESSILCSYYARNPLILKITKRGLWHELRRQYVTVSVPRRRVL